MRADTLLSLALSLISVVTRENSLPMTRRSMVRQGAWRRINICRQRRRLAVSPPRLQGPARSGHKQEILHERCAVYRKPLIRKRTDAIGRINLHHLRGARPGGRLHRLWDFRRVKSGAAASLRAFDAIWRRAGVEVSARHNPSGQTLLLRR
ncbi:hypothetical protein SKAU_G00256660 [Synaphobranchus kaupii]|uniref:Secreted protein n=1 Tax=Synaphobranchus kaupii TaxID=118154 RepID=A0A9Q1F402_SYNKA|nr:hypothetical protein SKAU_G00256660 [Synaphobranchus kaupii]